LHKKSGKESKLKRIGAVAAGLMASLGRCSICPRKCGVNRASGKLGYCRAPLNPVIYSYLAHHGEEPALSGRRGSGTIFFSHCNMKCVYCQNYTFSQLDKGEEVPVEKLASIMLDLQEMGCHNINLVSPTHFAPQILNAVEIALQKDLDIPIVYNTSGYESVETLRLLDGIVDIYLPDMRYSSAKNAKKYSDAPDYVQINRACIKEMHRQTGDLELGNNGVSTCGLIIRLLVLPNDISGTAESLKFIKKEISANTYLSIMSQYYPTFKAGDFKELSRGTTQAEYANIVDEARALGLNNGWVQEMPEGSDAKFLGTNIAPRSNRKVQ